MADVEAESPASVRARVLDFFGLAFDGVARVFRGIHGSKAVVTVLEDVGEELDLSGLDGDGDGGDGRDECAECVAREAGEAGKRLDGAGLGLHVALVASAAASTVAAPAPPGGGTVGPGPAGLCDLADPATPADPADRADSAAFATSAAGVPAGSAAPHTAVWPDEASDIPDPFLLDDRRAAHTDELIFVRSLVIPEIRASLSVLVTRRTSGVPRAAPAEQGNSET